MIVTITLNPAVDCYYRVASFEEGAKNKVNSTQYICGGKGINVSKFLGLLKTESTATGFLLSKDESMFKDSFSRYTDDDFIVVEGRTRRNLKVIDNNGKLLEFNDTNRIDYGWFDKLIDKISEYNNEENIVVVSGSLPDGAPKDFYVQILKNLDKCRVILDTSEDPLEVGLQAYPLVIKPNRAQLHKLIGATSDDTTEQRIRKAQKLLNEKQLLVVTLKDYQTIYAAKDKAIIVKSDMSNIKNTVGFGDSICACIAYGLLNDYTVEEFASLAAAVSSVIVSDYSEYSFAQQVNEMKKKVVLEAI